MAFNGEEDAGFLRREAAIASTQILQPDFKSSKATQAQLDKFKELNKRRLQLREKSKNIIKPIGKKSQVMKTTCSGFGKVDCKNKLANNTIEGSNLSAVKEKGIQDGKVAISAPRKKLHWGLDAKERWERKANM